MPKTSNRPLSPHVQIYRPQLTSVLSFAHRLTGLTLGLYSLGLVTWVVAAALGPGPFAAAQTLMQSLLGQILLFGGTFCFFLHLCGGIRHLLWDSGRGFDLRVIYASGWAAAIASAVLTVVAWIAAAMVGG
ncbi:MAG TPA: succinate dehydrogenase, cytochrome b556 subunit [Gammaproteobacteria bacterium]|nr:succinate dehydrogenase, cytochrome b556 subunit [Gammaproteobacteria bacterium]